MLHCATYLATCLAIILILSKGWELFLNSEFYWLHNRNIARQVARGMLHCAMAKKCVAALRQSLRKVEPDSTSYSASCNKNVARL